MIKFIAALKQSGHPFKISSEGEAEVTFIISRQELTKALPLVSHGDCSLEISVRPLGAKDGDEEEFNL